jgi:threonine dehydrogenase-like Zn-dependent dehydrogenase
VLVARDDLAEPTTPGRDELIVRTVVSAVSPGTELRTLFAASTSFPVEGGTGYMAAGMVECVGEGVSDIAPGDRVACTGAGPHRQRRPAHRSVVARVPDRMDWVDAACAYWIVPPYRGLLSACPQPHERAAVIGLGPLGLCAVQLLRSQVREVAAVDPIATRRALAEHFGASTVCHEGSMDVVVELSGTQAGLELALQLAAPLGRIVVLGVLPRLHDFELFRPMQDKGLTLLPLFRRGASLTDAAPDPTSEYLAVALRMVASGEVDVRSLCSQVVAWQDGPAALAALREHPEQWIGLALRWDGDG